LNQKTNKNDTAWEEVFASKRILEKIEIQGYADVTADELRVHREPRLMAKIDHSNNRPTIMKQHDLVLFSISNSSYRIGPFDLFQKLPQWGDLKNDTTTLAMPEGLQSLNVENITSENAILYSALSSEMLTDFCGEEVRATVSGRMRTGNFGFRINNRRIGQHDVKVNNTQVEIDAGLEGKDNFYLIEIKNHMSVDFNRRQLFFPLNLWSRKIKKPVRTIFLSFSNDAFDFFEFEWKDISSLSNCELVRQKRYVFESRGANNFSLYEFAIKGEKAGKKILSEAPFPQADNFERVIDLVTFLQESPKSMQYIAQHYDFDPRQSDYYFNAARFLGLAELDVFKNRCATKTAEDIFSRPTKEKYQELAKLLISFAAVRRTYLELVKNADGIELDMVRDIVKFSGEAGNIAEESTLRRRGQTVLSWANWLKTNFE
jgi:hypothetical protein